MGRIAYLNKNVSETERLSISKHIEYKGIEFFNLTKEQGLEGIVAKRKDGKYYFGKRTKEWIKCKALLDDDFIVCGYYFKSANFLSIILGSYNGEAVIYRGHVVMGVSKSDYKMLQKAETIPKESAYPALPDFDNAIWLKPELVCRVEYMELTKHGGLRQPIYRGLRDDKAVGECILV